MRTRDQIWFARIMLLIIIGVLFIIGISSGEAGELTKLQKELFLSGRKVTIEKNLKDGKVSYTFEAEEKGSNFWGKTYYLASLTLAGVQGGYNDARIYERDGHWIPENLKNDAVYLGGTGFNVCNLVLSAHTFKSRNFGEFFFTTLAGVLLGSISWDYTYGALIYDDPQYPYNNWAFEWGFKTREERIRFDIMRGLGAVTSLVISEMVK